MNKYIEIQTETEKQREESMEWCELMPKVELHAHLNGSIRDSTLLELARDLGEKGHLDFSTFEHVILKNDRSFFELLKLFDLIHMVTTADHRTITRITREVVQDFASENVVYIELRTTPKKNKSIGMSKRSYMEAVVEGLKSMDSVDVAFLPRDIDAQSSLSSPPIDNSSNVIPRKKIYVRLLLSIDRRETAEDAMETVKLALELKDVGVVGIDLSGNPIVGEWTNFLPALQFAKENGLGITVHCGEVVPNPKEIQAMLDFWPKRIGHACFFEGEDWDKLKRLNIPVEICLTSNIQTNSISSLDVHHFGDLYKANHPMVICSDDCGVFSTSISREYSLAASTFGLGKEEIFQLARNAIDFIFADNEVKRILEQEFDSYETNLAL